jgi:hypothetical protein
MKATMDTVLTQYLFWMTGVAPALTQKMDHEGLDQVLPKWSDLAQ